MEGVDSEIPTNLPERGPPCRGNAGELCLRHIVSVLVSNAAEEQIGEKMVGQPLNASDIRDRLLADIQLAFRGVQRGDGPTLHEADLEGVGSAEESRAARDRDTDSDWQEVPEQVIERLSWALCFVDLQGFRYYVPAYMSFALRHPESDSNSDVLGAILPMTLIGAVGFAVAGGLAIADDLWPKKRGVSNGAEAPTVS